MIKDERLKLPITIYPNKMFIAKHICVPLVVIAACAVICRFASGDLGRKKYSYPNTMFISICCAGITLFSVIKDVLHFLPAKAPTITIKQEGLQIHKKPYQALGAILWEEIKECKEMAFKDAYNSHGRLLCFAAKNLTSQLDKITDENSRKDLQKAFKKNNNWLYKINLSGLDHNDQALIELINSLIAK